MDFHEEIQILATRIQNSMDHIKTEEATKQAFVMPFLKTLGYDIWDPREVVPEFTADVGTKKGEKVDYAIMRKHKPIMLVECKWSGLDLDKNHFDQLFRYFSVTEARIGILTNGIIYKFYTDLEKSNQMDSRPFLEFNILDFHDDLLTELKRFTKSKFDIQQIMPAAHELKYTREIKLLLVRQLYEPSESFVKFFATQVYSGRLRQHIIEQFQGITKRAFRQFINDQVNERLRSALNEGEALQTELVPEPKPQMEGQSKHQREGKSIDTTPEEVEGFRLVREILKDTVNPNRIFFWDTARFSIILLDDVKKKVICRMRP